MKLLTLTLVLLCGCVSYKHAFVNPDGSQDTTRFGAFIYAGQASKIRTSTKSGTNYNRTVSVGTIDGAADAQFIQGLVAGIIAGMKASQGIP